jgi:type IV pilus assembly protein PilA
MRRTQMISFIRSSKGFTLIELLIVVAIIAILATIGITQYGLYRMKGYHAASITDLKNFKSAMEAYFIDNHHYP